jgi:hypothetical protein
VKLDKEKDSLEAFYSLFFLLDQKERKAKTLQSFPPQPTAGPLLPAAAHCAF